MAITCESFKLGDIVTFGFIPNNRFYGTVVEVCPKEDKVYVDVNGKVAQFDPRELMIVLENAVGKIARRGKTLNALYWAVSPRKYKRTQVEKETGEARCPKCKAVMNRSNYTKKNKLNICPECDFKIPDDSIVDERTTPVSNLVNEVRSEIIAKKVFGELVQPLRKTRDYGQEGNGSMNDDMEQMRNEKIAKKILAEDYEYQYDPEHKVKPAGGGWTKTEKGWQKGKSEDKEDKPEKKEEPKSEKPKAELTDIEKNVEKEYPDAPEHFKNFIKKSRKYLKDLTGKDVKELMDAKVDMEKVQNAEKDGHKAGTMELVIDSVWKTYLKGSPEELAEGAKNYIDSGKFTHQQIDDFLAWGEAKGRARLDVLTETGFEGYGDKPIKGKEYKMRLEQFKETVTDWQKIREIFKGEKTEEKKPEIKKEEKKPEENKDKPKSEKPYKMIEPKKGTLDPVHEILSTNGLKVNADEIKELTGFKDSIKKHQRLTEKAVEKMKTEGAEFWPRNAAKLKAEFLKNMEQSNYPTPEAYEKAKERMRKVPAQDFGKILDAIASDEDEI